MLDLVKKLTLVFWLVSNLSVFAASTSSITFAITSGFRSSIFPVDTDSGSVGGSARFSRLIREERLNSDRFVLLDLGDHFAGRLYNLFDGEPEIELMNYDRYDAMLPGREEFAMGEDRLDRWAHRAGFPLIVTNIIAPPQCKLCRQTVPHLILERGGLKIGIFGLVPADFFVRPPGVAEFDDDICSIAKQNAEHLAEKCEIVVLLSQLDIEQNQEIAQTTEGIDIILASDWRGFTDEPIAIKKTLIVGCHNDGISGFGILNTGWSELGELGSFEWTRVALDERISPDPKAYEKVEAVAQKLPFSRFIRTIDFNLDARDDLLASGESNFGNLVCDAMLSVFPGSQVALLPAGSVYGDRLLSPGAVTDADIVDLLPYDERAVLLLLRGDELEDLIQLGLGKIGMRRGGFLQVSGLSVSVDTSRMDFRIVVGGRPLETASKYSVVTTDFVSNGGFFSHNFSPIEIGPLISEIVTNYLTCGSEAPSFEDRISILP